MTNAGIRTQGISHAATVGCRRIAAAGAFALCVGAPLRAQSAQCAPAYAAMSKLFDKPFHSFTIDTAQTDAGLHGGQPRVSESIWTGTGYYIMVRGQWSKSRVDVAEMRKDLNDASTKKATCSHVRDESVNGEAAALWRIHSVSEDDDTTDTDAWISKSSGLVLKSDVHLDIGTTLGKSHIVSRYEYTNVRLPAGVR